MLEHEWKALLGRHGLAVPRGVQWGAAEAPPRPALAELRPPLVLKALSPRIIHKTDVGAVRVGIGTLDALADEAQGMEDRLRSQGLWPITAFLAEEMAGGGLELLVGMTQDEKFGRILAVGAGGIAAEGLNTVCFRVLPLRRHDLGGLLESQPWLTTSLRRLGTGRLAELEQLLWDLGGPDGFALTPELEEFEINPLVIGHQGPVALDVRGRWAGEGGQG